MTGVHESRQDGTTHRRAVMVAASLISTAAGYLIALFALTTSNGFWPVPWTRDDYMNLNPSLPPFDSLSRLIRPVSTIAFHLVAMLGRQAFYAVLFALVIASVALACRLVTRMMQIELPVAAQATIGLAAAFAVGLHEHAPFVVRYTGSFTHLLSGVLAMTSLLLAFSWIDGSRGPSRYFLVVYAFAVLAKEDVPPFVTMALVLYAAVVWSASRDRLLLRRGIVAVASVLLMSVFAVAINMLQQTSYVRRTIRGSEAYAFASGWDFVRNFATYLFSGKLMPALLALYVLAAVAIAVRRREFVVRYMTFGVLVLAQILPYALLSRSHIYQYYSVIWLPLLAAATAMGMYLAFESMKMPVWGRIAAAVAILFLLGRISKPERDSIAGWLTTQQLPNARMLYAFSRLGPALQKVGTVYVTGIDDTRNPFILTDAEYVNHVVGNDDLRWIVFARHDSLMARTEANWPFPVSHPHVVLRQDANPEPGLRPVIRFDSDYRAHVSQ